MKSLCRTACLLLAVFSLLSFAHAAGSLVSGPMLGYAAQREVFLWFETKGAQTVALDYWIAGKPETKRTLTQANPAVTPVGGQIIQFRPGLLEVGTTYEFALSIDGMQQAFPFPPTFKTKA